MQTRTERVRVRFASCDVDCAAWHYPGTNGACVVMAAGGAVTKEPGTAPFARRFHDDGFTVLAFDFRRLGESGGQPPAELAVEVARSAPHADIAHVPGRHYAPFLDAHEQAVDTQLLFLRRQRLAHGRAPGEFLTATSESDRIR
ncbi:hypothetical protein ACFXG4_17190 [Nocardia sp. NPDC059246]|uniref:hypothetical protein n=1 Tax=unclassified Nocardia TaxID=2637762 RepID=UPI0036BDBB44